MNQLITMNLEDPTVPPPGPAALDALRQALQRELPRVRFEFQPF